MKKLLLIPILALAVTIVACTSSQVQTIEQLIGIAVDALPTVISLLGASPAAVGDANAAQSDFSLAETLISGYQADSASATTTAQKVSSLLTDAQSNLTSLVAAVPASSSDKQKIGSVATVLIGVAQDIIADLPSSSNAATVAHVKLPKPNAVKKQIQNIIAQPVATIGGTPVPVPHLLPDYI